ncbi:hypothetical protein F4778DRAFT_802788 [Xylariomycetidae sp. FL2044]|nr:hypothetical protein F4778DRAFT_802788 [Xylariomycetidae sp. FL2044]
MAITYELDTIKFQSQDITFSDWITLFTLCFAPLIAHVLSGAPRPSYLAGPGARPRWHDRMCLYNPTSILWRYAAIADRRIRARVWDNSIMAASNALFWTSRGWDGSEAMVRAARPLGTRLPEHARVEWVSSEMLWTVVVTLQGASAVYSLVGGLTGLAYFNSALALDSIFFPMAVFGLMRLCAGAWLTDDFHFETERADDGGAAGVRVRSGSETTMMMVPLEDRMRKEEGQEDLEYGEERPMRPYMRIDSLLEHETTPSSSDDPHSNPSCSSSAPPPPPLPSFPSSPLLFHPTSIWPSRLFRVFYMLPILGLWALASFYVIPWGGRYSSPATAWLVGLFFLAFFTASGGLYAYYFVRGLTTSTLLPCIGRAWYKVYTLLLFACMAALVVVAALETRKTPCGRYTSLAGVVGDLKACADARNLLLPIGDGAGARGPFALLSENPNRDGDAPLLAVDGGSSSSSGGGSGSNVWAYNFTGICLGSPTNGSWDFAGYSKLYRGSDGLPLEDLDEIAQAYHGGYNERR